MGNKQKGSNAERELIHLFWATQKWTALRVAGSGSMNYPSPDVLASNEGIHLAIECKATISKSQYLEKREVHELIEFAKKAGARPLVAVRFKRTPWYFLNPTDLNPTEHHYAISQTEAERRGMTFEEITAKKS